MKYFCLPREFVEAIQNFPPVKEASRDVNFYLKDGRQCSDVTVVGNEFYAMDTAKNAYFEPTDISFVEPSEK